MPSQPSTDIQLPGDQAFWLTNGVAAAEVLETETLFDVNIVDTNIREDIEISVRGEKQKVKHSLYFIQYVLARVMDEDEDVPVPPRHVFRPRPQVPGLVTPNGPGPMPGLPGGPPLRG